MFSEYLRQRVLGPERGSGAGARRDEGINDSSTLNLGKVRHRGVGHGVSCPKSRGKNDQPITGLGATQPLISPSVGPTPCNS